MTLEGDDEFGGEAIDALTPQVEEEEEPIQEDTESVKEGEPSGEPTAESNWQQWYRRLAPLLGYLPTGKHEEDTERDGPLSYAVEVHAAAIGVSIGVAAAMAGDMQLVMALITIALGVGRAQQQFSEKVQEQLVKEPVYALAGLVIGYALVDYDVLAQLPLGV